MILRVLPRKKSCADAVTRRLNSAISGASIGATSKPMTCLCTTLSISLALVGLVPAHLSHKRLVVGTSLDIRCQLGQIWFGQIVWRGPLPYCGKRVRVSECE